MPKRKATPKVNNTNKKAKDEDVEPANDLNPLLNRDVFSQIGKFLDLQSLLRLQSVSKKISRASKSYMKSMFSDDSIPISIDPHGACKMFANKKNFNLKQNNWKSEFFKGAKLQMIIYFYAHERFPGGNADMCTKKWDYKLFNSKAVLKRRMYGNWDGNCLLSPIFSPKLPDPSTIMDFFDKAANLIYTSGSSCQFQIPDDKFDSESGDCEWFSITVQINVNSMTVLEYQRKAVCRDGKEPPKIEHPETTQAKHFFDSLCELTGEVKSLHWERKKCRALDEEEASKKVPWKHVATDVYDMPTTLDTEGSAEEPRKKRKWK